VRFDISDHVIYIENNLRKRRVSRVQRVSQRHQSGFEHRHASVVNAVHNLNLLEFLHEVEDVVPVNDECVPVLPRLLYLFLSDLIQRQIFPEPLRQVVFLLVLHQFLVQIILVVCLGIEHVLQFCLLGGQFVQLFSFGIVHFRVFGQSREGPHYFLLVGGYCVQTLVCLGVSPLEIGLPRVARILAGDQRDAWELVGV